MKRNRLAPAEKLSLPGKRFYQITRGDGRIEVLVIPATARLTIFSGRIPTSPTGETRFGMNMMSGGQLRVYIGNRLIGFFPDVRELFEMMQAVLQPMTLTDRVEESPFAPGQLAKQITAAAYGGLRAPLGQPVPKVK